METLETDCFHVTQFAEAGMQRFTPWLWGASLFLLVAMSGMYLADAGILVHASQDRFVLREGNVLMRDDGKVRPRQSPPFFVRTCSYWEGFRVRNVPMLDAGARCPVARWPR
jgi:hypothetical protein